jgi:hypothetical protein
MTQPSAAPPTTEDPDENGRYPTRDELDYARRREAGFPSAGVPLNAGKGVVTELQTAFAVEGNDTTAYQGVTVERMTYANDTEQPLAAQEGVELDREEALIKQPTLVAPVVPTPQVEQTDGGGSSVETIYTATSGERFSAEIAEPVETEKVPAEEGTGAQPTDDSSQVEKGVSGGSSGQTVSDAEAQKIEVTDSAAATPSTKASRTTATPRPTSST